MIYEKNGSRKYLTRAERQAFLDAANLEPKPEVTAFCLTLAYTGARISEVLALTTLNIDFETRSIVVECLKRRRGGIYRAIPVPDSLLQRLRTILPKEAVHIPNSQDLEIWGWSRTTAWAHVKRVMISADISQCRATPKTLRHSF